MTVAQFRPGALLLRAVGLALLAAVASLASLSGAAAQISDSRVVAVYDVRYNGVSLGQLNFTSTVKGSSYELQTDTKLKLPLLGSIFESLNWRGLSQSRGSVLDSEPHPASYHFDYKGGGKQGAVDMAFAGDAVTSVSRYPDRELSAAFVPVEPEQLRNVVDPMTAVMLISRKGASHRSACARTFPIYDGEQRFNLALSYKRAVQVKRDESGGYEGPVIVCRVRYQPISGYKPNKEDVQQMAANKNIELWLMPLPGSRNYAPYRVVLPLPYGEAGIDLAHFRMENPAGRQVALVRQ